MSPDGWVEAMDLPHNGRRYRLTDVAGEVLQKILV